MKTNNLWEADQVRKLTTVLAVDELITRCAYGLESAEKNYPVSKAAILGWKRKLSFLAKLKEHVEMGGAR
jgi:hypothetical protein